MNKLICKTVFNLGILLITGCAGDITQFPQNAAVGVGGAAVLNCTSTTGVVAWYLSRDGTVSASTSEQITNFCDVKPVYSSHYKTEPGGGFQPTCNLIVLNATLQQAGVYVCSDGQLEKQNARALVTVVDLPLSVTANQSDVMVGETLSISCTIGYNGSVSPAPLLPPSIYWTSSTGEAISSSLSPTPPPNSVQSNILVRPDRSSNSIGPFICNGYFGHPQNPPDPSLNYATNAPTTTYSTTSSVFNVYYVPGNVVVSVLGVPCQNDTCTCACPCASCTSVNMTCNAEASPPAEYTWYHSGSPVYGPTIVATENKIYRCTVCNRIHSVQYNASKAVTVSGIVDGNSPDETVTTVLGIFMAISALVNILLVFWIVIWLLPKATSKKGSIPNSSERYLEQTDTKIETTSTNSPGTSPTLRTSYEQSLQPVHLFKQLSKAMKSNEQPRQLDSWNKHLEQTEVAYEELSKPQVTSDELRPHSGAFYQELNQPARQTYQELRPRNKSDHSSNMNDNAD